MSEQPTQTQVHYWRFMNDSIVHVYYLDDYLKHYQWWERSIKIFLALSSSTSIASWAIWQDLSIVWASIIALSQVINSIKHLLPLAQREKLIRQVLPELTDLHMEVENNYYDVSNGLLSDKGIHELTIKLKKRKSSIVAKLDECSLPDNQKLMTSAEERANIYLDGYYGG